MSDELKPQSIGEDREFHRLLAECEGANRFGDPRDPADALFKLIAHIDAWGARLAADSMPTEMTPAMMRAVQLHSELGEYACSNLSGAYDLFREFWDVAVAAARKEQSCGS
jgi:hypothetical protein